MKLLSTRSRMKNCLFILLLSALVLLAGCGPKSSKPSSAVPGSERITIVTSFYPMYIMALNVTADVPGIKLQNLTGPQTGCLHDYQLTPNDVITLQKADAFIVNGADMESFLDKVVKQQPQLKIITASQGISLIKSPGEIGDNPHVWVSIGNAVREVNNIAQQLAELDPEHAIQYQKNAAVYTAKLENLSKEMHKELDGFSQSNIVTFHEAFPYFAKEFNLNIVAVVEREPGSEPSAAELAQTVEIVRKSKAQALFTEPQYPADSARLITQDTGVKAYVLDPAVSGPDNPDAYLNIMRRNLKTLKEALQ